MRTNILALLFILFPILVFSQEASICGKYKIESQLTEERIDLFENGTFSYFLQEPFLRMNVTGNWQVRSDSLLVLDSHPQKTKMLVWEDRKIFKKTIIHVRNMRDNLIVYHAYLISNKGDTIVLRDQFDKTVTKEKITSFYLLCTTGVYSPTYTLQGGRTNDFTVHFETQRVFENEFWIIKNKSIIPMGMDGKYVGYELVKEKEAE